MIENEYLRKQKKNKNLPNKCRTHTHTDKDGGRRVRLLDYPEEKVLVFELKANGFDGSVSGL